MRLMTVSFYEIWVQRRARLETSVFSFALHNEARGDKLGTHMPCAFSSTWVVVRSVRTMNM